MGTDHAFVPIYLIKNGTVDKAWASDVNSGPLKSAEKNALECGVRDRIGFFLSDGLDSCRCCENLYDHVVIAGMGGELISDIIRRSDYLREKRPVLILQPMTMQPYLRGTLASNGYSILYDEIVSEDNRFYTVLVCRFNGERNSLTEFETFFGKGIAGKTKEKGPDVIAYLKYEREVMRRIFEGRKRGNLNCDLEERLISEISSMINEE